MASNPRRKRAPPYQTTVKGESFSTFLFLFFFSFSLSLRWTKFRSGFFYVLTGCLAHPSFLRLFLFISLAFIRAGLQKYRLRLFQTCYVRDPRCFFFLFLNPYMEIFGWKIVSSLRKGCERRKRISSFTLRELIRVFFIFLLKLRWDICVWKSQTLKQFIGKFRRYDFEKESLNLNNPCVSRSRPTLWVMLKGWLAKWNTVDRCLILKRIGIFFLYNNDRNVDRIII